MASRQVPDAFFIDREGGRVVVLELCRTSDLEPGYWKERRALKEKKLKYAGLLEMIRRCTGFADVTQATLVIGIRGSLNKKEWRE